MSDRYHCVYPRPGADLAALPSEWMERAEAECAKAYEVAMVRYRARCAEILNARAASAEDK